MIALLYLVAAAPTVVVHVAEVDGVTTEQARDLSERFCDAVELRTGEPCKTSSSDWQQCSGGAACVRSLRASAQTDEVVLMRFFGGALSILVSAERHIPNVDSVPRENFNVDRRRLDDIELTRLAAKLYPAATVATSTSSAVNVVAIQPSPPTNWAPVILAAVSVGATATAVGLGVSAQSTKNKLETTIVSAAEHERLLSDQSTRATAANVMIGIASASAIGALTWWLLGD